MPKPTRTSSTRTAADTPTRIRNRYGQHAQVPVTLVRNPTISHLAVRVYALLWSYGDERNRDVWPSRRSMADELGVSVDTIDRGIKELVLTGAIAVEADYDGVRQTSNVYTILVLPEAPEVIHRGRKFAAGGAADLRLPGASNLRHQDQEPQDQELGPVPDATNDRAADDPTGDRTGPGITPSSIRRSATVGQPLRHADVFAAIPGIFPETFTAGDLDVLAARIIDRAPARVRDVTGYVIRTLRNRDGQDRWHGEILDIDLAAHTAKHHTPAVGF